MRARLVLLLLASLIPLPSPAQQLSETMEVRLLEVDVVVTDKSGAPVHGLTAADFELYENGRLQQVSNLSEYREADAAPAATATVESRPQNAPETPARPKPRMFVLLLDPLPLRGARRIEMFESLRSLIARVHRPGDQVQILTWTGSGFRPNLELTSDRARVETSLSEMGASPTAVMPAGISIEERELFLQTIADMGSKFGGTGQTDPSASAAEKRAMAESELAEMRRKTASMQRIVTSLAGPSRKSVVIYASESFGRVAGMRGFAGARSAGGPPSADEAMYDTTRLIATIAASANANGVAFYTLHPVLPSSFGEFRPVDVETMMAGQVRAGTEGMTDHLLLKNEVEALTQLARETGGAFGAGPEGVVRAIEQIATDLTSYYSLGWRARSDGSDRERRVTVRVKNPAYTARSRTALVEKSDRTRAEDLLVARLFERAASDDIDFEVKLGAPENAGGQKRGIPVDLTIPADQLRFVDEAGGKAARFTVLAVAGKNIGQTTKITRDTRRVPAAEGQEAADGVIRYRFTLLTDLGRSSASVGVFDENSGLAGVRTIELDGGVGSVAAVASPADAVFRDSLDRATKEKKPLVVFFRPKRCRECDAFERDVATHPAIARRMPSLSYAAVLFGSDSKLWPAKEPGLAIFDETAELRARWIGIPATTELSQILDAAIASAPNFQRAAQLTQTDGPYAGASEAAIGLAKLGRAKEARAVLTEASEKGDGESRQLAAVTLATLDAREGRGQQALATLAAIARDAKTPRVAAEAWLATGLIQAAGGAVDDARRALRTAVETADPGSPTHSSAASMLVRLQAASTPSGSVIRIVPPDRRVVKGRQRVRTIVTSTAVARVEFTLDGEKGATVTAPPFAAELQFGDVAQTRTLRAVAFDRGGVEIGRDELRVNDAGEVFWLRIAEPAAGPASGRVKVTIDLRAPAASRVMRIALSWNDAPAATIATAPWTADVDVPNGIGVLRAVAELDDGRTAEDAVLLNASGAGERAEVQLVELPVTLTPPGPLGPKDVTVREGRTARVVESVTAAGAAPLTVGILIDWSASMRLRLPDVQEAALRFVESVIGPADRAFVMAFHSEPRLLQAPTSDREALRRTILSLQLQPEAPTAVHDAMILGLLQFEGARGRRALIMFTDGLDQQSRYTANDLTTMSRRSNVPVYIVTPPLPTVATLRSAVATPAGRPDALPSGTVMAPRTTTMVVPVLDPRGQKLYDVANASGGKLYEVAKLEALQKIYDSIAEALKAQALITIRTDPATKENEWRAIEVELARRGSEVRAPAGYYAPR